MTNPQRLKIHISAEIGEVSALLLLTEAATALLVLSHGAGANMEHSFMEMLAQRLASLRFNVPLGHRVPLADRQRLRPATFYQSISFDLGKKTFTGHKH